MGGDILLLLFNQAIEQAAPVNPTPTPSGPNIPVLNRKRADPFLCSVNGANFGVYIRPVLSGNL